MGTIDNTSRSARDICVTQTTHGFAMGIPAGFMSGKCRTLSDKTGKYRPRADVTKALLRPIVPFVSTRPCRPVRPDVVTFGEACAQRPHLSRSLLFHHFRSQRCLQRLVLSPFRSLFVGFVGNRYRASRSVEPWLGSGPWSYHEPHSFIGNVVSGIDSPRGMARRYSLPNLGLCEPTKKASAVFQRLLALVRRCTKTRREPSGRRVIKSDSIPFILRSSVRLGRTTLPFSVADGQAIWGEPSA